MYTEKLVTELQSNQKFNNQQIDAIVQLIEATQTWRNRICRAILFTLST